MLKLALSKSRQFKILVIKGLTNFMVIDGEYLLKSFQHFCIFGALVFSFSEEYFGAVFTFLVLWFWCLDLDPRAGFAF